MCSAKLVSRKLPEQRWKMTLRTTPKARLRRRRRTLIRMASSSLLNRLRGLRRCRSWRECRGSHDVQAQVCTTIDGFGGLNLHFQVSVWQPKC